MISEQWDFLYYKRLKEYNNLNAIHRPFHVVVFSLWSLFLDPGFGRRTAIIYSFGKLRKSEYGMDIRCHYKLIIIFWNLVMVLWLCGEGPFFLVRSMLKY